mmetsp:Transcript_2172/g.3995  ORF Transcript_2172/g.3995 Transcript_2172/m.3995 type:complete len:564 (-) Transcript_2172:138-1829(-)
MSSSSETEDLFGASSDSGEDTDELIAASSSSKKTPPIATKKKTQAKGKGGGGGGNATGSSGTKKKLGTSRLYKKTSAKSRKDGNNDDEDDSDDDEARGLFDSDDDDDDNDDNKEEKEDNVQNKEETRALSKRERMEALKNKARKAAGLQDKPKSKQSSKSRKARTDEKEDEEKEKGYDSGDSYDSGVEYQRTKEDDDFIDVEGDDEDAIKEYYKEQHFDDERPDGHDEGEISSGARKGSSSKKRGRGGDGLSEADKKDQDNPIMAAVNRMKKKKKVVRTFEDLKIAAEDFVSKMEYAADEDDLAIKEKRPGLKKLQMLPEALDIMTNREMIRPLLESDLLSAVKRWIQPLPDGSLGNVTVRQSMIDVISKMGTGEDHGIDTDDLKKSGFGKLVMVLYNHKQETPAIKKQLRKLIEEWSRTIFGKSGNMRDLASVQSVRVRKQGLTTYSRASMNAEEVEEAAAESLSRGIRRSDDGDIGAVLSKGVKQARDLGRNRVRIPVSKGFQYSVRPSDVTGDVADKKTRISNVADKRESLHKRMLEKSRPVSKNARSANISIEGRPTKG